jgi:hypothetical protein
LESFGSRLVLAYKGCDDEIFQCVLRNIVCLFFVLAVLIVLRKVAFHGRAVSLLGKISFHVLNSIRGVRGGFFFAKIAVFWRVTEWKRGLEKRLKHWTKAIFVILTLFDSDVRM